MTTDPERPTDENGDGAPDADDGGTADTAGGGDAADSDEDADRAPDIPRDAVDETERLTRLARDAVDHAAAEAYRSRRDELVADHGYTARVREEDDTVVCYPEEWVEDGTVRLHRVEDTDRAVERTLSGPGDPDEWKAVEDHNAAIVERVREAAGDTHAANASALADFMGNHYAKEIESASEAELREFREEYYPRNVWPDAEQERALERSLELTLELAEEIGD